MTFYMLELHVTDLARSVTWYETTFGATVERRDAKNNFALLSLADTRLALKQGVPTRGTLTPFINIANLDAFLARVRDASEVKTSAEGYRRVFVTDPDGYRWGVFAWAVLQQ